MFADFVIKMKSAYIQSQYLFLLYVHKFIFPSVCSYHAQYVLILESLKHAILFLKIADYTIQNM